MYSTTTKAMRLGIIVLSVYLRIYALVRKRCLYKTRDSRFTLLVLSERTPVNLIAYRRPLKMAANSRPVLLT